MKLSQETIAIVSVGLTLLGTVLYTSARIEDRIVRIEETARADREAFEAQILRLTEGQSRLSGTVDALRTASQ